MWTIALFVGDENRQVNLCFRGEASARAVWGLLGEPAQDPTEEFEVSDDYGTTCALFRDTIVGRVLQHAAGAADAQVELGLLQARSQQRMQRRAAADPMLNGRAIVAPPVLGPQ